MEIKYLRLVKNIVELGSMAKSKDKLCLTQSALSHQLKEAEQQAGTALFVRSNKKLILTEAGKKVYDTAIDVLEKIDKMDNEIQQLARGEKGIIRICTSCFTNYYWLPALINKFSVLHPQVDIRIHPEYVNEAISRLQNHELDAVITSKPEECKNIRYFELMSDELVAMVPPDHEWTKKPYVQASDFKGIKLIIFSKPKESVVVYHKVLKPSGIEPSHIYEIPMTESMVEMVVSNLGVAVIPYWIAKPYIQSGKVSAVRVTPKGLFRSLGIALIDKEEYPPYYQTFIDFIREMLADSVIS